MSEIQNLSIEELDENIELYQDRIETITDYINDEEDQMTRSAMTISLNEYKSVLHALRNEKYLRTQVRIDNISKLDLNNFLFKSSDHLRYENGKHVSGPHGGAGRAVKVESNINGGEGFTVTLYNLDGNHPIWQNNVQMAPKQMKVIEQTNDKIVLRGYGQDAMGASFADYGLTIKLKNGELENCILHMHDRGVDIEYLP
jgi:hypothetical protein